MCIRDRFNIILHSNYFYIILANQHICHIINIIHKGTDYPYAGYIIQIVYHRFQRNRKALALKLLHNAHRLFYAGLDHFDWIALVSYGKFVI